MWWVCNCLFTWGDTVKFTKNSSGYDYLKEIKGGAEKEADQLKNKILTAKNTEEIYDISGKKYYISRDMSLKDIPSELNFGDAVLFERGGLWRIAWHEGLNFPEGITVGAYGVGDKPKFYGSVDNYADNSKWEKVGENLYKHNLHGGNAGIMVFDGVAALGVKKWNLEDVKSNYDFFYEGGTEDLYFYYEGNIGEDFKSIEIGQRENIITVKSHCTVDNLCIKYSGSHGIVGDAASKGVTVTNCEVGMLGGSMQFGTTRFGNGIELQLGAENALIKNNYVYQCYDAGITFQSWTSAGLESLYHDIDISENLIENCCYGIEYFTTNKDLSGLYSEYKNISFNANIIRFSGYEWSELQRPDPWMRSHLRGGNWAYMDYCENFRISDNIFDVCDASMVFWWWHDETKNFIHPEPHQGLTVENNTFYQGLTPEKRCMTFHKNIPVYASNEEEFINAVKLFDKNPKKTVWFEK